MDDVFDTDVFDTEFDTEVFDTEVFDTEFDREVFDTCLIQRCGSCSIRGSLLMRLPTPIMHSTPI